MLLPGKRGGGGWGETRDGRKALLALAVHVFS